MLIRNRIVYGAAVGLNPSLSALTADDRSTVARYVATQHLRTPAEREAMEMLARLSALRTVRAALADGSEGRRQFEAEVLGRPLLGREREPIHNALVRFVLAINRQQVSWLPLAIETAWRLAALVETLEWRIVTPPNGVEFVMYDAPVVAVRRGATPDAYDMGGGWADPAFEATVALSPSHALHFTHGVADEAWLRSAEFAVGVRHRTIAHAREWVFARHPADDISQALKNTRAPSYAISFEGLTYRPGDSMDDIEQQLESRGIATIDFRYSARAG